MAKSTTTPAKRASTTATGDAKQQQKRKRRRRNIRTGDVSSSSDSSDSSTSDDERDVEKVQDGEKGEEQEVVMKDVSDIEDDSEEEELEAMSRVKTFTEKSSTIPSTLRDLHDPLAAARFEEYYMHQLTTEFGDDLNAVRLSKDFGASSLPMLVRALKQGINIFDAAEKRVVVGSTTA